MTIDRKKVKELYQKGANQYDFATILFRAAGLQMKKYRIEIIQSLDLKPGDTVVELGCGTGLNFDLVMSKIGTAGKLIGVDISSGMLEVAKSRISKNKWTNVVLIESDIVKYNFPSRVDAIFSTGVFGYIPEYELVIENTFKSLTKGGHIAILDGKRPEKLPKPIFNIVLALGKQYGYTEEYFEVSPWKVVDKLFSEFEFNTRYGGMIYEVFGVKP